MSEVNHRQLLAETLQHGAVKVPALLDMMEVAALLKRPTDPDHMFEKAPTLARFLLGLRVEMQAPDQDFGYGEIYSIGPGILQESHTDDSVPCGISVLVPLSGPEAQFYFSDVPQRYPDKVESSRVKRYGVGDVMLLRQAVEVNFIDGPDKSVRYSAVEHIGVAREDRTLLVCDLITPRFTLHPVESLLAA